MLTRRIWSIRLVSSATPPSTASVWPSSDEPVPNATIGTPRSVHVLTIAETSSVERGNATASGGASGKLDSSWPWRLRTESEVDSRSPSSAPSTSIASSTFPFTAPSLSARPRRIPP